MDFINEILIQLGEEGIDVDEGLDPSLMSNMLRVALNSIVGDMDSSSPQPTDGVAGASLPSAKKSAKLGSKGKASKIGGGSMEDILQNQADGIADDIEGIMDDILDMRHVTGRMSYAICDKYYMIHETDYEILRNT